MKIALISKDLPSGSKFGQGYQMHYIADILVDKGHDVTVFSQYPKSANAKYNVKMVPVGDKFRTFRFALSVAKQDFSNFDIIHASGEDALLFLSKNKPPQLRTFHGSSLAEAFYMRKLKEITRKLQLAFLEYISCIVADKCVLVSKNTRRFIPFVKDVIYNGVDLNRFKPGNSKSSNPSILFVGTLGWRKRGKMLVDIFKNKIKPKITGAEMWLVANEKTESAGIVNLGRVTTEKLIALYQKAWVFCLPSTYEGFGIPYVEAMACGAPVVASPNLGAKEVLDNGKYGIIVDDTQLSNTLIDLLQNQKLREEYTQKGLQRAREFNFDKITTQYENLYYSLLNTKDKRAKH